MKETILNIVHANRKLQEADAIIVNGEAFTFYRSGLTRRVFVNADRSKVIKVPVSKDDYSHNIKEAQMWQEMDEEKRKLFVPCRLLSDNLLEMDFVYILDDPETDKKFGNIDLSISDIKFAMSCRNEVGFDKEGKLRCFDYDEFKQY